MTSRTDPSDAHDVSRDGARRGDWYRAILRSMFALRSSDRAILAKVAPLFAVVTAASVIVATFTRAVFLTDHTIAMMPYMFLGSAIFTAIVSIGYVAVIEKISLVRRFVGLLLVAEVSFFALHLLYPLHPKGIALVQLVWCTGISQLLLIQTWNMTSVLVPARQGKRLFPVFAAVSTLGAAAGGGLVSLLLKAFDARHLMGLVLGLLLWALLRVGSIVRALSSAVVETSVETEVLHPNPHRRVESTGFLHGTLREIGRGFRSIAQTPLLLRLAVLVFLLQVASLILDFQFSSTLKARFSRDELANFLGMYYGIANTVAFGVALFATSRVVRIVGIGMAISASAVAVGIGSTVYFLMASGGGLKSAFWILVATSFAERIGQFALARNAMQVLVMPLETRKGERAKTLIDGVIYRVATASVSLALLLMHPTQANLYLLAPPAIVACLFAVMIGLSMNPHYRRALFEGLRARRVDSDADPQTRALLVRTAMNEVRQKLRSNDQRDIFQAIDIARESRLPVHVDDLMPVALGEDEEAARRALEAMNDLGVQPEKHVLLGLLARDRGPSVIREVLRLLGAFPDKGMAPLIAPFLQHTDVGVARLAYMWLRNAGADQQIAAAQATVNTEIRSEVSAQRARAVYITGAYGAVQSLDLVPMLEDPSPLVRANAVISMGQIGQPEFIDPLIDCLGRGDLVQGASNALCRYGADLLGPVAERLRDHPPPPTVQLRLLRIIERVATPEAVALLMIETDIPNTLVRSHAILSLWRIARQPDNPRPPRDWVRNHLLDEIERLNRYQDIEAHCQGLTPRHRFFLSELQALRLQADARGFRLLGMIHSRAAMHRAYLHYRSPHQRTRSTAIELLDQHIVDPVLKPFVNLVERNEGLMSGAFAAMDTMATSNLSLDADVDAMLGQVEPWLGRVWHWAQSESVSGGRQARKQNPGGSVGRDPMDMVFVLKGVPLLSDLSGEQLLPITDIVQHVHVDVGDLVFAEGQPGNHLYVIVEGQVEVLRGGDRVAVLGVKECFGEMALLDQSARSASVRAIKETELLVIARDDFQDLLDLHPALARGVIRVLTQRLRVATEALAQDHLR